MIRPSRLQDAERCGFAGSYQDNVTTSAGLLGDAFHAANAFFHRPDATGFRDARDVAMAQLLPDEQADVRQLVAELSSEWSPPPGAVFEVPIAVDRHGCYVEPGSPAALTDGTGDCAWEGSDDDGPFIALLDFKSGARAAWNVPPPHDNLQLAAYGFGYADLKGVSRMKLGLCLPREPRGSRWRWATVDLNSPEGTALWARVRAAASRDPAEMVTGPQCADCYIRLKCPAHLLPALHDEAREHALEPMTAGVADGGLIEPARLVRLLGAVKAMEDLAEAGKEWARAYVRIHGPIVADGKQWGPVETKGRESTSVKKLKETGLYDRAVAVGAVSPGVPTQQFRWTNAPKET